LCSKSARVMSYARRSLIRASATSMLDTPTTGTSSVSPG
jgi:hypothetical protein